MGKHKKSQKIKGSKEETIEDLKTTTPSEKPSSVDVRKVKDKATESGNNIQTKSGDELSKKHKKKNKKVKKNPDNEEGTNTEKPESMEDNSKDKKKRKLEDEGTEISETKQETEDNKAAKKQKLEMKTKKREKMQQKKELKIKVKENAAASEEDKASGKSCTEALAYLKQWKDNKNEWHFQKVRQTWLLQNMYDDKLVDESHFELLLEYLQGLQGKAKEITVEKADKLLESDDTSSEAEDRIRQVLQALG